MGKTAIFCWITHKQFECLSLFHSHTHPPFLSTFDFPLHIPVFFLVSLPMLLFCIYFSAIYSRVFSRFSPYAVILYLLFSYIFPCFFSFLSLCCYFVFTFQLYITLIPPPYLSFFSVFFFFFFLHRKCLSCLSFATSVYF